MALLPKTIYKFYQNVNASFTEIEKRNPKIHIDP